MSRPAADLTVSPLCLWPITGRIHCKTLHANFAKVFRNTFRKSEAGCKNCLSYPLGSLALA